MVLTVSFVLSPVIGFLSPSPTDMVLSLPGRANKTPQLDASAGASGPHDFTVRESISRLRAVDRSQAETRPAIMSHAQRCRVHRIPFPTSVTIAIRPSSGTRRQGIYNGFDFGKTEIFFSLRARQDKNTSRR